MQTEGIELLEKLPRRLQRSAKSLFYLYTRRHEIRSAPYVVALVVICGGCVIDVKFNISGFMLCGLALAVPVFRWLRAYTQPIEAQLSKRMADELECAKEQGLVAQLVKLTNDHPELCDFFDAITRVM